MAITIRDFNFIPSENESLNLTLLELQATLADIKVALMQIDQRLNALEEV